MVKYTANGTPSEDDEEIAFSNYLETRGFRHTHLSNEMFTKSMHIKARMKRMGVHSGTPDHLVIVPCKDGRKRLVFVEMKRQKGGTISDNQFDFIYDLIQCQNVIALVANGADEACKIIEYVEALDWENLTTYEDEFLKKHAKNREKREKALKNAKNVEVF